MLRRCASLLALVLTGLALPAGAFAEIVQREGTVRVRHSDDFASGVGRVEVSLDTGSELIPVIPGARADELQAGDEVRLTGDLRADRLSLARTGRSRCSRRHLELTICRSRAGTSATTERS